MTSIDTKKILVIIFILIFIGIPVGFGLYKGTKALYYNIFGIKSSDEIRGEQNVIIKNYQNANKAQQKIIKYKTKETKINDKVVTNVIKKDLNNTEQFNKIKSKIARPITKKEKQKLINQVELMNKKKIKQSDSSTTKNVITIDPVIYKIRGMRDINSIYNAYDLTEKE